MVFGFSMLYRASLSGKAGTGLGCSRAIQRKEYSYDAHFISWGTIQPTYMR